MWVRGLKLMQSIKCAWKILVAPYVGAWIETSSNLLRSESVLGRTLCGCVD